MAKHSFGELQRSYAALWKAMQIPAGVRVQATDARVRAIAENKPRYDRSPMRPAYPGTSSA